jgi:hypothetical protein
MSDAGPPGSGPGKPKKGVLAGFGAVAVLALILFALAIRLATSMFTTFNAPGREALIAAGCDEAHVADLRSTPGTENKPMQAIVICLVRFGKDGPTCEALAQAYGKGVPNGPPRFLMTEMTAGDRSETPRCSGIYDATGTLLGPPPPP